jgi:secreted trypsin-like serine protease
MNKTRRIRRGVIAATALATAVGLGGVHIARSTEAQAIQGGYTAGVLDYGEVQIFKRISEDADEQCSGTVIDTFFILTAKHCADVNPGDLTIFAGSVHDAQGTQHQARSVVTHRTEDVAIIETEEAIQQHPYAQLAGRDYDVPDNTYATISGWGATSVDGPPSPVLKKAGMQVDGLLQGRRGYQLRWGGGQNGGVDREGDSGGPVIERNTGLQIGVISGGDNQNHTYAVNVSYVRQWIRANSGV